jgi:hypothetical protein
MTYEIWTVHTPKERRLVLTTADRAEAHRKGKELDEVKGRQYEVEVGEIGSMGINAYFPFSLFCDERQAELAAALSTTMNITVKLDGKEI